MDARHIQLPDSEIAAVQCDAAGCRVIFSRALIIKTLTGSVETTLWWQPGELVMEQATALTPLPAGALICIGGDIDDNIYTYRDMIPIPLASRGHMRCMLRFQSHPDPIVITAAAMELVLHDTAKYIRHIRPQDQS